MNVLGIYGSPRKGGNTDLLLDRVLDGAASAGGELSRIYVRDMVFSGCVECGGCDETGVCIVRDDMQEAYLKLVESRVIFLASPVFFLGPSSQTKAFIDRAQALWRRRMITKTASERKRRAGGAGYLVMAAATLGPEQFRGSELTVKYFFDALDMSYNGAAFFKAEQKGSILESPEELDRAYEFGKSAVAALTAEEGG
ncbi:MAG: flavodoxin family protein [Spirochaetes bacterium]|nr:flavodoxin family protein [Spirochaetota bacterium]